MTQVACIIGAGPAGLTAAYELLRKTKIKPVIYEASPFIGGISRTTNHNGNRIDIGGHRFFSKSDAVMKMWLDFLPVADADHDPRLTDDVMLIRNRLSRILYNRHLFDYPLSLTLNTITGLGLRRMLRIDQAISSPKQTSVSLRNRWKIFLSTGLVTNYMPPFFATIPKKCGASRAVPCRPNGGRSGSRGFPSPLPYSMPSLAACGQIRT